MTDFSFISNQHNRSLIANGYMAVSQLELWKWLKKFNPDDPDDPEGGGGFSWSNHPNIDKIGQKMESLPNPPGHSGCSFAITMRHLEFIAKEGLDKYKTAIMSSSA